VNGACFPTPAQKQAFRASFLPPTISEVPAASLPASLGNDPAAPILLPLLDWRWGDRLPADVSVAARSRRLTLWRQGREHMELAVSVLAILREAAIHAVLLKGTGLNARYYDAGVRAVGDVDFLVPPGQVHSAAAALAQAGWTAEGRLTAAQIQDQMRVRHAWQFYRTGDGGELLLCDLHWHPVVRCYAPRVAAMFLEGAETAAWESQALRIPCATDLLFHTTAHGLQWSWTSPLRWIPDAWFVLRAGPVDWDRFRTLAVEGEMTFRVHRALEYLKTHFDAAVPEPVLETLAPSPPWQSREQALLEQPSPLGLADAARWHLYNFRRLRRFDPEWQGSTAMAGFASYLKLFFHAERRRDLPASIWRKVRS
jgi:hypothetical protein